MKDTQIKKLFKESAYIVIDTREKDNYIKDTLEKFGIKYRVKKLDYGDYGIEIDKNVDLGIEEDIRLKVSVERKGSLEEISGNLTKGQTRFYNEMERAINDEAFMIIMIEGNTYSDIVNQDYKTNLTNKQFLGLLHGITAKYGVPFIFIDKKYK